MSKVTDEPEISELVGYLRNIKEFELTNYVSEASLANFSWGIMMLFAGIADLHVSYFVGYSPHFFIWFFAVSFTFIIQNIISTQPLINVQDASQELRPKVPLVSIIVTFIIFMGTLVIAYYRIEFVLPYIALSLAIFQTLTNIGKMVESETSELETQMNLHTIMLYVLTVILLIEGYLGSSVQIFQGLTFGIMFGFTSIFRGYNQRKFVRNKIDTLASEEEL